MPILDSGTAEGVKQELADLGGPVRLVMFTQEFECDLCAEARALVEEVAATSEQLAAEIYNFVTDKEKADSLGIDKIPAIAVIGAEDYGLRFYGIPSGYEFGSFLAAIKAAGSGEAELEDATVLPVCGHARPQTRRCQPPGEGGHGGGYGVPASGGQVQRDGRAPHCDQRYSAPRGGGAGGEAGR
jgi:hypothetical protein